MNLEALTIHQTTFDNLKPRKLPILKRVSYFVKINPPLEDPSSFNPLDQLIPPITVVENAVNLSVAILSEFNF